MMRAPLLWSAFIILMIAHQNYFRIQHIHSQQLVNPIHRATIFAGFVEGVGNVLRHLYFAHVIQKYALEGYGIHTDIVLYSYLGLKSDKRHENGFANLLKCWPQFRSLPFLDQVRDAQVITEWKHQQRHYMSNLDESKTSIIWQDFRSANATLNNMSKQLDVIQPHSFVWNRTRFHFPILTTLSMTTRSRESFAHEIRSGFLQFDMTQPGRCPSDMPLEDETVLYFRNRATEFLTNKNGDNVLGDRFLDVSPSVAANQLLGHLPPLSKVVLVTPLFPGQDNQDVHALVHALEAKGLKIRLTPNKSAMEDLCFMMHTKKELVGSIKSTYYQFAAWAAQNNPKIRFYAAMRDASDQTNSCNYFNGNIPPSLPCEDVLVPRVA